MGYFCPTTMMDPKAAQFMNVFEATRDGLYRLFLKATRDESLTEDLVQESYLRLWESWSSASDPTVYVFGIAHHLVKAHYRRKGREVLHLTDTLPDKAVPEQADSLQQYKETQQRIYASMEHLTPEKRAALVLIKEEERSYKEASAILGVPVSTLEKQIASGMKHLRKALLFKLLL